LGTSYHGFLVKNENEGKKNYKDENRSVQMKTTLDKVFTLSVFQ